VNQQHPPANPEGCLVLLASSSLLNYVPKFLPLPLAFCQQGWGDLLFWK
jgi:hypothetical protein